MLTVNDVAEELRVSVRTVYRLIHDGALRCVKIRRQIRIRREDLDHYLRPTAGGLFDV